ncbi:P-loop containing nucleoside triphosphate hydrolase protein [Gloeopeniophorella convolvens]|nr:P-loop containing nucleoside triphosphate hydrolase protein [Gloeopeniophorella convolvens]
MELAISMSIPSTSVGRGRAGHAQGRPKSPRVKTATQALRLYSRPEHRSPPSAQGPIHEYKVVLLGDSSVGKSLLFGKITSNESRPTRSILPDGTQVACRTVEVGGFSLRGNFWDQGSLRTAIDVKPAFFSGADAAVLVYHVASRTSYDNIPAWLQQFREYTDTFQLPVAIVGNDSGFTRWTQRKVSKVEASTFAAGRGFTWFQYSPSTTDSDLEAMYTALFNQIHNRAATSREPSVFSYTTVNEVVSVKDAPYRRLCPPKGVLPVADHLPDDEVIEDND